MPDNREIVLEALLLHDKGEFADKIIKSILDKYSYLERFERSFINRVFTGTVERRLTLDYIINQFSTVKVNKQKPVIRAILRMSAYQLMYMDAVPDSAAINEAVKLAKKKKFNGLTGFVNGVLRKISRERDNLVFPDRNKDFIRYLSVTYSCPEWLCSHFVNECGKGAAENILKNSLVERPVIVRTNLSKTSPSELKKILSEEGVTVKEFTDKSYANDYSFIIDEFDGLSSLDSFNDGLFCIQDLSSQNVLFDSDETINDELIGRIKSAELIVDVCASPGGKTCHIADLTAYYDNSRCKILSRDLSDNKVDRIDENVDRCGFDNVYTQVRDALVLDESIVGKADIIIADLPCSGLGVIGRKSDIKYRVQQNELEELSQLQQDILRVVTKYLKKDGMLIFSTCTVNEMENSQNARWIEEELKLKPLGAHKQIINDSLEHDGFFISRFVNS